MTQALFDKYYPKDRYEGGTIPFLRLCANEISSGSEILEIGAGPGNPFSEFLSQKGRVTGIDVSPEVGTNQWLSRAVVFDGREMPFENSSFDACCSNWVLEHVEDPAAHFREVARVLRPGGVYCFRTPNLYHYVSMGARLLPFFMHLNLANRLRSQQESAHDPYPTFYRANTRSALRRLCAEAGFDEPSIRMIEPEPSYGAAHALLFYPMMMYERVVNRFGFAAGLRVTMLSAVHKACHGTN